MSFLTIVITRPNVRFSYHHYDSSLGPTYWQFSYHRYNMPVKLSLLLLGLASTLGHSSYHQYNLTIGWLLTGSLHATVITRPYVQHKVERNSSTRPARSRM